MLTAHVLFLKTMARRHPSPWQNSSHFVLLKQCPKSDVVPWGVFRYVRRTWCWYFLMFPSSVLSWPCTALSANPFEAGWWYGAEVLCLIPFFLRKVSNSWLVNPVPLSVSGKPNFTNTVLSSSMTIVVVQMASIHFEWALIKMKKVLPKNKPAKSWPMAYIGPLPRI